MEKHSATRGKLQVFPTSGIPIQLRSSADTFVEAIDQVVDCVGVDQILNCKRNLNRCKEERYLGFPLVSANKNDYDTALDKYKKTLKLSRKNLYINTCSSNKQKAKLLKEIFEELGLDWKINIVE